jgi:hypothetical protein
MVASAYAMLCAENIIYPLDIKRDIVIFFESD